ncbi:Retrovirus-related Pol polyprotein from transposon TNT 1-94 [Senna tora]|uniref:Retrovirus-related Pol polyprotein from transposon TNT 1-94 n=1 Tax=Senna tora TaxID=362788 RepID=A0A834WY19_9FABA|nr:Retrovirus-related Pol polyprotein from transposon TNT 1-94 [Senna tora]
MDENQVGQCIYLKISGSTIVLANNDMDFPYGIKVLLSSYHFDMKYLGE